MAAFGVAYAVTSPDIAAANAYLAALSGKYEDMTPLMQAAGAIVADASERSFAEERSPDGQDWPPPAASTANAKVTKSGQRRGEHPILQVFGRLAASLAPQIFPTVMVFGTNLVKSALLHFGGFAGRGHLTFVPARPYIGLGDRDAALIEQAAVEFLASSK